MEALISKELASELNIVQQEIFARNIPVLMIFEGSSGRVIGRSINEMVRCLEPRGIEYHHFDPEDVKDPKAVMGFLDRTPAAGIISMYDRSWYSTIIDRYDGDEDTMDTMLELANRYERYLSDNGVFVIKILMRARPEDLREYGPQYGQSGMSRGSFLSLDSIDPVKYRVVMLDRVYERTDTKHTPWNKIDVGEIGQTVGKLVETVLERLSDRLKGPHEPERMKIKAEYPNPRKGMDMSARCDSYEEMMDSLSEDLYHLQTVLAETDRSLILGFEGWDAAGKGSAIKHVCHALNPRGYAVSQTKAPTEAELAHTYLWRFCRDIPESGHITVYDRTWYGRMLVEPVEGFCTDDEYRRAASEINLFEKALVGSGAILLKFWMEVSPDEQLSRFQAREADPLKRWKITDDDWRNRSKWKEYDRCIDVMMESTNTPYAPWTVIESDDKKYARIKVLRTIVDTLRREISDSVMRI